MLMLSSIAAYLVFHGQYVRFKQNPTVLSIQLMPYGTFPRPSLTICPKYSINRTIGGFEINWKEADQSHRDDVKELLKVIFSSNFTSLDGFKQFTSYVDTLNNVNLQQLINMTFPHLTESAVTNSNHFRRIITEVGVCFTTNHIAGAQDLKLG